MTDFSKIADPTPGQIAEFRKLCISMTEGIELEKIIPVQWDAIFAEHDRLGRPLDTAEVLAIIGRGFQPTS